MLFSQKNLKTLEYDKIIAMLAECAPTEGSRRRALSLSPTNDFDVINSRQEKTEDAKRLINAKGYPVFSSPESVVPASERAYKGAVLSPAELLDIASLFHSARMMLDYINTDKPFSTSLDEIFNRIIPNREHETKITRSILSPEPDRQATSPV
jgi:DNA mismatch repair protein MutS2